MTTSTCPFCNSPLDNGAKFCPNCGGAVPSVVQCPQCGTTVKTSDKFCPNCGHGLQYAPSQSQPQSYAAQPVASQTSYRPNPPSHAPKKKWWNGVWFAVIGLLIYHIIKWAIRS